MNYRALDALLAAIGVGDGIPPKKKDDGRVPRKPTNLPLTQMEPFADSLQIALGVRPSRTRYLPAPLGDEPLPPESRYIQTGPNTFSMEPVGMQYAIRGSTDTGTGQIDVRAGAPRDDYQATYAHELGHLVQKKNSLPNEMFSNPLFTPPSQRRVGYDGLVSGDERGSELLRAAWQKWSGRPVDYTTSGITGAGKYPLDTADVGLLAKMLERSYNRRK